MTVLLVHAERNDATILSGLGHAEYSYYFVLKAFLPALEPLGHVIRAVDRLRELDSDGRSRRVYTTRSEVEAIHDLCRRVGEPCILLSFSPPHRTEVDLACPTIPVFAWEFHDLPNETWDNEPRHDWCAVLRRLGRAITHSGLAAEVVRKALGDAFPVVSIPAPVWDRFAALRARGLGRPDLGRREVMLSDPAIFDGLGVDQSGGPGEALGAAAGFELDLGASLAAIQNGSDTQDAQANDPDPVAQAEQAVVLSGVVYTTVLSPRDGRKNWLEMLRAFCFALGDRDDVTLVVKLVGSIPEGRSKTWKELERLQPFLCRVVFVHGFLADAAYEGLALATTYAVNASSGEGQCLPLMEYMSAGVPAIAPRHTAMLDYLDGDNAFIVDSSLEPAVWPHDTRYYYRTLSHRLNIESLMDAFRASYAVAKHEPGRYAAMSGHARERLRAHCSMAVVRERLTEFLAADLGGRSRSPRANS